MTVQDDQDKRLVYEVPEAGELLGLGRNAAYAAARSGALPTIRIGKKLLRVPKAELHKLLASPATSNALGVRGLHYSDEQHG